MVHALVVTLISASLLLAAVAVVLFLLDRPAPSSYLAALAGLEVLLAVQVVVGLGKLAIGDRPAQPSQSWVFGGYLLGCLLVLPAAVAWSLAERSKWGTAVLALGGLVMAVVVLRMQQVWTTSA